MSGAESADHVSVHLTGCADDDAGVVFGVLEEAFPEGTGPPSAESRPARPGAAAPTVWCLVVDARTRRPPRAAGQALGGAVTVDLFGAADPVRQVKEELAEAFAIEDQGTIPGEHELEARLRLTSRPAG
ncbi:hypothetical protein [Streptomyces triculaminicus]|uniref:hypothetical protein n=1 Tax=Streptomyces triculaminicus TaxID=2816232 RepID=UPI0037CDFAC5